MHKHQSLTEEEANKMYDESLNELGEIQIGNLSFMPSEILKKLDPIAYRMGFLDYVDIMLEDGQISQEIADKV